MKKKKRKLARKKYAPQNIFERPNYHVRAPIRRLVTAVENYSWIIASCARERYSKRNGDKSIARRVLKCL